MEAQKKISVYKAISMCEFFIIFLLIYSIKIRQPQIELNEIPMTADDNFMVDDYDCVARDKYPLGRHLYQVKHKFSGAMQVMHPYVNLSADNKDNKVYLVIQLDDQGVVLSFNYYLRLIEVEEIKAPVKLPTYSDL